MATRNLTVRYEEFRSAQRNLYQKKFDDEDPILQKVIDVEAESPAWVAKVESIHHNLMSCADHLIELGKAHNNKLRVDFGASLKTDRDIDNLTALIKGILEGAKKDCWWLVKSVESDTISRRLVMQNVLRGIGVLWAERNKQFFKLQRDYKGRLKSLEAVGDSFRKQSEILAIIEREDEPWTADEKEAIQELQKHATARQSEIIKIAQSVNELHSLFTEVNALVLEQGTILDRIDVQIDKTLNHVEKGKVQLIDANRYSKKALKMKCIVVLVIMIIIEVIILIVRIDSKVDTSSSSSPTSPTSPSPPTPVPAPAPSF